MTPTENILENIQIASPCPADWSAMVGNDQVRFCEQCQLNVYNLSGMTRQVAEALVKSREGRLCVRFFRRADGTVLTQDCPVGLRIRHRRRVRLAGTVAAAFTLVTVIGTFMLIAQAESPEKCQVKKQALTGKPAVTPSSGEAAQVISGEMALPVKMGELMGDIATPPAPPQSDQPMMGTIPVPPPKQDDQNNDQNIGPKDPGAMELGRPQFSHPNLQEDSHDPTPPSP